MNVGGSWLRDSMSMQREHRDQCHGSTDSYTWPQGYDIEDIVDHTEAKNKVPTWRKSESMILDTYFKLKWSL